MVLLTLQFPTCRSRGSNGLLYTQKKFGWTVTDYTNYQSFWVVHMSVKVVEMYSHLKIILIPSLLFCGGVKYEYRLKGRFVK